MRFGTLITLVTLGLTMLGGYDAAEASSKDAKISFDLEPASSAVAGCLADAVGRVTVFLKEETRGVDTLHLSVRGLPANTDFAVFLTSADAFATPAFGATQYIGDFTTNAAGNGKLKAQQYTLEAGSTLSVKGVSVTVEASASLTLKGATVDVQASGPLNLKGAIINIG